MEVHLPESLQFALYAASLGVVAIVVLSFVLFLVVRKRIFRLAQMVEDLRVSVDPLVSETRMMVQEVSDLTQRAHEQWVELESTIVGAQRWARRASYLASMMTPASLAAGPGSRILNEGMRAFAQAILSRTVNRQQKARAL